MLARQIIILSFGATVFLAPGCGREESRDALTGPAVRAAKEVARGVEPGTIQLTAFSAYDTGDLTRISHRALNGQVAGRCDRAAAAKRGNRAGGR